PLQVAGFNRLAEHLGLDGDPGLGEVAEVLFGYRHDAVALLRGQDGQALAREPWQGLAHHAAAHLVTLAQLLDAHAGPWGEPAVKDVEAYRPVHAVSARGTCLTSHATSTACLGDLVKSR